MSVKKIMIAGMGGQLGLALSGIKPVNVTLIAPAETELDITSAVAVEQFVEKNRPDVIINCAAYTAVDQAETDSEKAYAVNCEGVKNLAVASVKYNARFVHISTDFVFDGFSAVAYKPDDRTNPLSVYGKSKLAGESAAIEADSNCLIIRTSWLYSSSGNNFVKTMLRLMAERESLGVVVDQIGTPTWADSLAEVIWAAVETDVSGVLHWSDAGVASWYDFAQAIHDEGRRLGLLSRPVTVKPIPSASYPTPAARPAFSVMDKTLTYEKLKVSPVHWRENLIKCLTRLQAGA